MPCLYQQLLSHVFDGDASSFALTICWTTLLQGSTYQAWQPHLEAFVLQAVKSLLILAAPLMQSAQPLLLSHLQEACAEQHQSGSVSLLSLDHLQAALELVVRDVSIDRSVTDMAARIARKADSYRARLEAQHTATPQGTAFQFVEAALVDAVRMGHWVLLDSINSAPPEAIERINSLLEEQPSLNITEHAEGLHASKLFCLSDY